MKLSFFAVLLFAVSVQARDMDGCYQLGAGGGLSGVEVSYPTACLVGSNNVSTKGAGARLALFGVYGENAGKVIDCKISTSLSKTENNFRFQVNDHDELILRDIRIHENNSMEGVADLNTTHGMVHLLYFWKTPISPFTNQYLEQMAAVGCLP